MKYLLFSVIYLLTFVLAVFSQQTTEIPKDAKTKLEIFQAKTGVVIISGFSTIGSVKGLFDTSIEVTSREFTDASNGKKEYGITIHVKDNSRKPERENISYIDYDEIDSLIKSIDYLTKIDDSITQLSNFRADYRTKDNLTFAIYNSLTARLLQSQKEILFTIQSKKIDESSATFKFETIFDIKKLIVNAKAKLDLIKPTTKANTK